MNAYPETLLPNARSQLADAADYAVIDLGIPIDEFFSLFAASDWARRIERGDRSTILGISGIELVRNILAEKTGAREFKTARESLHRTKAYWTGWVLAYYQWKSNRTFKEILRALPASTILREKLPETRLRRIRSAYGCSQSRLAKMSGVGLRSIQMYEQRRKSINRAEAESVLRLARALGCEIEDIMEP